MEVEARRFWDEEFFETFRRIAYRFGIEPDAPYPFYEIRRDHVVDWLGKRRPGRLLDLGCGGGHVMETLLERGWKAVGCDFSPRMVAFARERLASAGWSESAVEERSATDLSAYEAASFDVVLCLGPIEYLDEEEAAGAYAGIRRVLRRNGIMICAHINGLFDLFTLDRYTAEFLEGLLARTYRMSPNRRADLARGLREHLGTGPETARNADNSLRSRVPTRADNPLTIAEVLNRFGFKLDDRRFYRFYTAPPAVARALSLPETEAIDDEQRLAEGWPGHILASSFLTFSVKS